MKSDHWNDPATNRPVPDVRGNASRNGQPAGAGNDGSLRWAATGTPLGRPGAAARVAAPAAEPEVAARAGTTPAAHTAAANANVATLRRIDPPASFPTPPGGGVNPSSSPMEPATPISAHKNRRWRPLARRPAPGRAGRRGGG